MSYYTLFTGWLPLSPPLGFFALLVPTRPLHFRSVTVPLVLSMYAPNVRARHRAIALERLSLMNNRESKPPYFIDTKREW